MRIEKIDLITIRIPLKEPFQISKNIFNDTVGILVKLYADNGYVGIGESIQLETPWYSHEILDTSVIMMANIIVPLLLKQEVNSPLDLRLKYDWIVGNNQAITAFDTALWDISAQMADEPLYKHMGGVRNFGTVGTSLGIQSEVVLMKKIEKSIEEGYQRIKVKVKPGNDNDILASIRNAFPDIRLMVDANASYSLKDIDVFKKMDQFNLTMIEQPFGNGDLIEHSQLLQSISTPICLDESIHDLNDSRMAIALSACQIVNIKPPRVGGPTRVLTMLELMKKNQISGWIGGMMESGVGRAMNLACATLDGIDYESDLRPPSDYLIEDIVDFNFELKGGKIFLPEKSGIGVSIDQEKLKRFTIEVKVFE